MNSYKDSETAIQSIVQNLSSRLGKDSASILIHLKSMKREMGAFKDRDEPALMEIDRQIKKLEGNDDTNASTLGKDRPAN